MIFFNNLFSAIYCFYKKWKEPDPRFASVLVLCLIQFQSLVLLFVYLSKLNVLVYDKTTPKYFIVLVVMGIWVYMLNKRYTRSKAWTLFKEFNAKPSGFKLFFQILALILFVLPGVLMAILLQ